MIFHILLLLGAGFLLFRAADMLVKGISKIAQYLKWREFVIAFFVMAIAGSAPNLFIGVSSALHGIPELSFGDMIGNNTVDLTLVVALAVLFGGTLTAKGAIIQQSALLTIVIAILPLLLIVDGVLGRGDGIVLILVFFAYSVWLLRKRKGFAQPFHDKEEAPLVEFRQFLKNLVLIVVGIALLLVSAEGMVRSASFFADAFQLPIALFGILVIGLGNALPEMYFSIAAARKQQNWIVLGQLMGAVIVPATLVIGIVALIHPIVVPDFSPFSVGRFFLIISAFFFLLFTRTERKITRTEALFLIGLYLVFVAAEIFTQSVGIKFLN